MDDFFKVVPKEAIPTDLDGQYPKTRDQLSGNFINIIILYYKVQS